MLVELRKASGAFPAAEWTALVDANDTPDLHPGVPPYSAWYQECSDRGRWPCRGRVLNLGSGTVDILVMGLGSSTPDVRVTGQTTSLAGLGPGLTGDSFTIDATFALVPFRPFMFAKYTVRAFNINKRVQMDSYDSTLGEYGEWLGGTGWGWNRSDTRKDIVTNLPIGDPSTWKADIWTNSSNWGANMQAILLSNNTVTDAWVPDIWGNVTVGPLVAPHTIMEAVTSGPVAPPPGQEGWRRVHDPSDPQGVSATNGFNSATSIITPPAVTFPAVSSTGTATLNACPGAMTIDTFNATYSNMNLPDGCSLTLTGEGTLYLIRDNYFGRNSTIRFTGTNVAIIVDAVPPITCPTCPPGGSLSIQQGTRLNLDANTTLKLYLRDTGFMTYRSSLVNADGEPPQFILYARNSANNRLIGVAGSSERGVTTVFKGFIYAPDNQVQIASYVDLSLTGTTQFYGGIVGKTVSIGFQDMNQDNHIEMHSDTAPNALDTGLAGPFGQTSARLLVWHYRRHGN